jgi:DNA-binding Lrp family transcriptional regulator
VVKVSEVGGKKKMIAFVLIQLKQCDEKQVLEDLRRLDRVKEVHVLFGNWDMLAKIEFEGPDDLGQFMIENIRSRKDITKTETIIAATQ